MSDTGTPETKGTAVVGYRQPPTAHRFKKGRSGNPRGRPRKKETYTPPEDPVLSHYLGDLVMLEAIRPIQIRENDQVVELPLIQAVIRSLGVAAVKGSHRAQIALASMVKAAQDKTLQDRRFVFESALEYKRSWEEVKERCDARGEPYPEPIPHPDEVRINTRTSVVTYNGPQSLDEKAEWDKLLAERDEAIAEIAELEKLKKRRSAQQRAFLDRNIRSQQQIVDLVDDLIPDEKTRREPDFNLSEWRDRKEALRELKEKYWRNRP